MKWTEVRVNCLPQAEEAVSAVMQLVCGGACVSEAGTVVRGWLPEGDQIEPNLLKIRERLDNIPIFLSPSPLEMTITHQEDIGWNLSWREFFHAFDIAGRFRIRPPWESDLPGKDLIDLIIDPGMAFGTGQHPTTAMMLEVLAENPPEGLCVLDVGAGSGILAIAAAKLGAKHVAALEVDPAAEENARRNISLNGTAAQVDYQLKDGTDALMGSFQMALANIVADVIIPLAPGILNALDSGALFACSGVIDNRVEEVKAHLCDCGFAFVDERARDEWRAIVCRKP